MLLLLPHSLLAQDAPALDVFAGYSILPANGDDFPRPASRGLQVSVTGHFTRWFAIVADLGAQFGRSNNLGPGFAGREANTTVRQLMVGPRVTARFAAIGLFGHGLFGVVRGMPERTFPGSRTADRSSAVAAGSMFAPAAASPSASSSTCSAASSTSSKATRGSRLAQWFALADDDA
jgi:hypothetical protein